MIDRVRAMPGGIRLFLVYALLILAGIGISLRSVVDLAISAPVSLEGVVVMVLLAYTIFTTTLVLQRKQAARGLALGLASLTIPLVPLLLLSRLIVEAHLRRRARACPVPRPAPARGPDLPERAVRTGRGLVRHDRGRDGTLTVRAAPAPPIGTVFRADRHPPTRHRGNHVSKASRRRQRPGTNPATSRPASPPPTRRSPPARRSS